MTEPTLPYENVLPEQNDVPEIKWQAGSGTAGASADSFGSTGGAPPFCPPLRAAPPATSPSNSTTLLLSDRIGDFELVRILGAGSFGQVYLARQTSLGRLVALKVSPGARPLYSRR